MQTFRNGHGACFVRCMRDALYPVNHCSTSVDVAEELDDVRVRLNLRLLRREQCDTQRVAKRHGRVGTTCQTSLLVLSEGLLCDGVRLEAHSALSTIRRTTPK
jgi:hypothetical protein